MNKLIYILILLCCSKILFAQKTRQDSILNIARIDVKRHKISRKAFAIFRKDRGNFSSDYLKPDSSTTSDFTLLKDSGYVQAYRAGMYKKTRTRRTTGHYILLGGAIYTAASLIAALVIIIALANGFN
ncbi:hypothetical protein [Pedobacter duraquae]|uniref:Uncharacterized protein n=1 Tax=Pedobacter duraquae TaxID=425511 RepID=A0A4R6IFB9_9SPHI|nr:hypothetical protein [Pedobacter duraquae]TDO19605.1 hypothetical protein CLV32_4227 [Pedobacter duraquae]